MTNEQKIQIGGRLKLVREKSKLTQDDFAKSADLSQAEISKIEVGGSAPGAEVLCALTAAHKIDIHWLLTGRTAPSLANESRAYIIFGRVLSVILDAKKMDVIAAAKIAGVAPILFAMWCRGECLPSRRAVYTFGEKIGGQELADALYKVYEKVLQYEKYLIESESLYSELKSIYTGIERIKQNIADDAAKRVEIPDTVIKAAIKNLTKEAARNNAAETENPAAVGEVA